MSRKETEEKTAIILVNWKDYARKFLDDCIKSIREQDGNFKIFIIDNESSDETLNYLKSKVGEAEIIPNEKNDGFARGNNIGIERALEEDFRYIALFNLDIVLEKNCLAEMIKAIRRDAKIGVVQARMMLHDRPDKINSIGNDTHFLGFGYCRGYQEDYETQKLEEGQNIFYPSGAACLFRAEVLREVGLFDEEFWMYNEDQDIGWRIWLAGFRCVLSSQAVVYHKYEFSRSASKYYWLDRNRILVMLKNYHFLTIFLIAPIFIFMELGLILYSLKTAWLGEKMRAWKYFFKLKNWRYILGARREIQKKRVRREREIIKMIQGKIYYQEIDDWKLKFINPFFDFYWRIVRWFIIF